jgi:cytoskeletal protein RodZ
MALHIIRDKKGRMEKILDDKEYDRHQARKGCFQFLFFVAIVGLTIYGSATQESDDSSKVQTETVAESEETDEIAETNAVETEDRNGMKEEETVSAEEDYVEEITTETEDTSSVIDEDELVHRFLENQ